MNAKLKLDTIYAPSENVVARDIQGEFIIIPITSGIGDLEDEIFTLNETGKAIWDRVESLLILSLHYAKLKLGG